MSTPQDEAKADSAPEAEESAGGPPPTSAAGQHRFASALARSATWSLRFLLVAAAVAVLVYAIGWLWVVVLPVLLGLVLSTVLWPPAKRLRRVMPDALAALLVLLLALLLLTGLGVWLVPQVADQLDDVGSAVSSGLEDLEQLVTGPPLNLDDDQIGNAIDQAVGQLQSNAQTIAGGILTGVATVGSILLNAVLAVVLCFFFLKDGHKFLPWLGALVGPRAAPHVVEVSRRSWDTVGGFIRAQAVVGLVDAVAIGIGLVILGVPLALPLAVLIFFGAFVPIVGAFVTGALAALVALVTQGFTTALIVVALVVAVQQLEGNVLEPVLVGHVIDLHPAVVILAITAGGSLFGIVGAFLSVLLVAAAAAAIRYGRHQMDGAGT